jgi:hypothetical protein
MDNKQMSEKYGLNQDSFWKHKQSGKWIISHNGAMKIAAQEGIEFSKPDVHRDDMTSVALFGEATLGDRTVWTFGEAMPENCRMPYFWAMAEKRLKDRLTLMLIDAYGEVYSEVEADEFSQKEMIPNKEYGPPSEKQKKYCMTLIEEKVSDENKEKWYKAFDDCKDTWAMSILIDRLAK